ncbi:hypothetical protein Gocc_3091 [Gaiella occulta]|uniref:Uncharacterized protein n=2 Tax=Gaiella occulta TaxID=1002870 RepID=A0A7M2YTG3_9ACTN|nr:hypothetical protein Gocc_3091 [Gaiella occulta]
MYRFFDPPSRDDSERSADYAALLDVAYDNATILIGDVSQVMWSAKGLLALVSEASATGGEHRSHVPWTRLIEDTDVTFRSRRYDIAALMIESRELFVIKKSIGYGGIGTVIGCECSAQEWEGKIEACLREPRPWVVQEWMEKPRERLAFLSGEKVVFRECAVDYGLFMFNGAFAGGARRNTSPQSPHLTHMSGGGGIAPLIVCAT